MKNILLLFCMAALFSCTSSSSKLAKQIDRQLKITNENIAHGKPDSLVIDSVTIAIEKFVKENPKDTLSPAYLFELSLLYQKQQQMDKTIVTLDRVAKEYPDSKQAVKAVFLEGFLYANVLNQLDKAKEKYQLYLDKYSAVDAKMTSDVKSELENLGKSPEQILQELQEKAKSDTASARS
ncbi:MAG: tetratricopeptide repeat protein [Chitinophagales bacterium]|nr:tetratricopeptide repeat protein [Chitinophagales bacterium]